MGSQVFSWKFFITFVCLPNFKTQWKPLHSACNVLRQHMHIDLEFFLLPLCLFCSLKVTGELPTGIFTRLLCLPLAFYAISCLFCPNTHTRPDLLYYRRDCQQAKYMQIANAFSVCGIYTFTGTGLTSLASK